MYDWITIIKHINNVVHARCLLILQQYQDKGSLASVASSSVAEGQLSLPSLRGR